MNLTWKQLLVCGVAAGALGYAGFRLLSAYGGTTSEKTPVKPNGRRKRKGKTSKKAEANSPIPQDAAKEVMEECELPVPELLQLSPENKQRVFYALLMKGEMLMARGPREMTQAIDYFSKAVSIVPNPGEVVAAFEKTLPPPMFNALLDKIQHDIQLKVGEYFAALAPAGVKFAERMEVEPGTERKVKNWVPVAARDFSLGATVWSEDADVSVLPIGVENVNEHCEYCLKPLAEEEEERMACPGCGLAAYCSDTCFMKSADVYHCYFCRPSSAVVEAMSELRAVCRENRSSLALLVLRYVAFLLSEELRGNGAANNGPFAHYDHLKPVFRAPSEEDKREVRLLRTIFSETNQNIVDFLSDEIYTSMKSTLARHCLAVAPAEEDAVVLSRLECRQIDGPVRALAFYHTFAHLTHSCDPNAAIVADSARSIRVVALKNVAAGDKLTVAHLPFASGTLTAERQLHLMRLFGLQCQCRLCEADETTS